MMADYSRYKLETLKKMRERAQEKYAKEVMKPIGNWGDGMRLSKLPSLVSFERAKERLDAIEKEIKRRSETVDIPNG